LHAALLRRRSAAEEARRWRETRAAGARAAGHLAAPTAWRSAVPTH